MFVVQARSAKRPKRSAPPAKQKKKKKDSPPAKQSSPEVHTDDDGMPAHGDDDLVGDRATQLRLFGALSML
jgi:hypothetical protein